MEAKDWLKGVEKKLVIAQCTDREKVLFADVDSIIWNEFKAHFRNHCVPCGTMKLKKKEFADLKQGGMTVNG
jgi:hypothetical protein